MRLAVIPARGGSKRIPRKNIKLFCGKPIVEWSINAALESGCFDQVVISTDDAEIAEVARQCGAHVPFIRPAELSDDHTGTSAVVAHAIKWFAAQDEAPEQVCCLYATAPFVTAEDLRTGHKLLMESSADYALAVTSFAFPIQRAIRINSAQRIEMFSPENFNTRSQDLEEAYHDAGQFYWGLAGAWIQGKIIFSPASVPVLLPRYRVQDIDTPEDWLMAEYLFRAINLRKTK
jgi:N-acylneuraminate cytidylyltransferase